MPSELTPTTMHTIMARFGNQLLEDKNQFIRLVLMEAARFGMPAPMIAMLDDMAAALGFYPPLPTNQAAYLAGPFAMWQTDSRQQPTVDQMPEVYPLALLDRTYSTFGLFPPGMTVGPAEIVVAMSSLIQDLSPPDYYRLFQWAMARVKAEISGCTLSEAEEQAGWEHISDEEVIAPGGSLFATYQQAARGIREAAIVGRDAEPQPTPRVLAKQFCLEMANGAAAKCIEATAAGDAQAVNHWAIIARELRDAAARLPEPDPRISNESPEAAE